MQNWNAKSAGMCTIQPLVMMSGKSLRAQHLLISQLTGAAQIVMAHTNSLWCCMSNLTNNIGLQFETVFEHIASTRMFDLPIFHKNLRVEGVGFRAWNQGNLGVLITPWFMSLIWLPDHQSEWAGVKVGLKKSLNLPAGEYEFLTAAEPAIGTYLTSSLFSPMFDFDSMSQARAVAESVLLEIFTPQTTAESAPGSAPAPAHVQGQAQPHGLVEKLHQPVSRRGFFRAILSPLGEDRGNM
jgi:[NiFe] hydrogenase assembly HybE family chaperone